MVFGKGGIQLKQELSDIEQGTGIKVLYRNRDGRKKIRGGGIVLAFRSAMCWFRERKIKNTTSHEILRAVGNVGKIKRKDGNSVLYVPPDTTLATMGSIQDLLGLEITAVK